jgi:hypothetical protein
MSGTSASAVDALGAPCLERDLAIAAGRLAADVVVRGPVLETSWSAGPAPERCGPAPAVLIRPLLALAEALRSAVDPDLLGLHWP